MSNSSIDTSLELEADYEKAVPGDCVSDEVMEELVRRIRVSARSDVSIPADVAVSGDSDNLLQKTSAGELRVQKAIFCSEQQDVPIPSPNVAEGTRYLVLLSDRCVSSVILKNGSIVEYPLKGQTLDSDGGTPGDPSDDTYTYPTTLQELADNLNDEAATLVWSVEGGQLIVESTLNEEIASVIECEEPPGTSLTNREVTPIIEEQAGDVSLTFRECHEVNGIDYGSQFLMDLDVTPGDGYERFYRVSTDNDNTVWKIEGVTKVLSATLRTFTPASPELSSDL